MGGVGWVGVWGFCSTLPAYLAAFVARVAWQQARLPALCCVAVSAAATQCANLSHLPCRAVNGFGLALVIPCVSSMIADYNPPDQRGNAFGLMSLTGALAGGGLARPGVDESMRLCVPALKLPLAGDGHATWRAGPTAPAAKLVPTSPPAPPRAVQPRWAGWRGPFTPPTSAPRSRWASRAGGLRSTW